MRFIVPPGYNIVPSQLFGQTVDYGAWTEIVAPAGDGPITGPNPQGDAVDYMTLARSQPSVFNIQASLNNTRF